MKNSILINYSFSNIKLNSLNYIQLFNIDVIAVIRTYDHVGIIQKIISHVRVQTN